MGSFFSVLGAISNVLFPYVSGVPIAAAPICYLRPEDYSISGTLRDGLQEQWNMTMHSMIFHELETRQLFWPVIFKRMDRFEASQKYDNCKMDALLEKFPTWTETEIFEAHDLFQAFEVDGDGLIEIAEMSVGLDNLGDTTSKKDRIPELCKGDEDGTGSIDYEEFLQILYEQQVIEKTKTPLAKTFLSVNQDIKFIRWMSTVQQIRAGFL